MYYEKNKKEQSKNKTMYKTMYVINNMIIIIFKLLNLQKK